MVAHQMNLLSLNWPMLGSESEIQLREGSGEVIFDPVCIEAKVLALIFVFAS